MAARRLLIVMLVLLGVSTLAAALIPQGSLRDATTTETTTSDRNQTATTPGPPSSGRRVPPVDITVGGPKIPVVACPEPAERRKPCEPIRVGDTLLLRVYSTETAEVEIPAFGLIGVASPTAPARFELLFRSAASYGVRFTSSGKIAARIAVLPAKDKPKPAPRRG
jgi:hypothetical protein